MRQFILAPLIASFALAGCGVVGDQPRTARAETHLTRALSGKVAGKAVDCLPAFRSNDMSVIDDNTILFRDGRSTVYRNDPPGGCRPIGAPGYALVTHIFGPSLCRGDIAQVVDTSTGMFAGSCVLGDFVPYRTAAR